MFRIEEIITRDEIQLMTYRSPLSAAYFA